MERSTSIPQRVRFQTYFSVISILSSHAVQVVLPLQYVEHVNVATFQHDFTFEHNILSKCRAELEKMKQEKLADDRVASTGQVDLLDPINNPLKLAGEAVAMMSRSATSAPPSVPTRPPPPAVSSYNPSYQPPISGARSATGDYGGRGLASWR